MSGHKGADRLCEALLARGVSCVFGLPGSQTVPLYEALRQAGLRCVGATHELAASFMANGYARASGRPAVLTTIPGPGFTYALTGLAEAWLDSAPVLLVTGAPATRPGRRFQLQALDQPAIAAPLVKAVLTVHRPDEAGPRALEALDLTMQGEPGPVLLQIAEEAWGGDAPAFPLPATDSEPSIPGDAPVAAIAARLAAARRPLFYLGQGAAAASEGVARLAARFGALVVTSTSGRGVVAEDDPCVLVFDGGDVDPLNRLADGADLVLALGCKLSHNGAHGFALRLRPETLVHVDAAPEVPGANYPCDLAAVADVPSLVHALLESTDAAEGPSTGWLPGERDLWRAQARESRHGRGLEPRFGSLEPPTAEGFFAALRRALPRDGLLVTDSGQHQVLARRYHQVLAPRGLVVPTNLQSMGFALPAAIGAVLAEPRRPVVALLGDGGLLMSGLELATAAREGLALTVIVLVDGHYGQIRLKQLRDTGRPFATDLPGVGLEALAEAVGVTYLRLEGDPGPALENAISSGGVTLVEVRLDDSPGLHGLRTRALVRRGAGALGLLRLLGWPRRRP